MQLLYIKALA